MEFSSFASAERAWTYDTPYDLARRQEIIAQHGKDSQRFKDIENYIDYINNDMPENYQVATRVVERRVYNPHAAGASHPSRSLWLHTIQDGRFIEARCVAGLNDFVGHKIALQNDEVFLVNTEYGLAAKPKPNKSIDMINIVIGGGDGSGYNTYKIFDRRINEVIGSYALSEYVSSRS